jgi:bacillithiol system protein YtxJ
MSSGFKSTTHLSEIIENSDEGPVIIFKYSSECGSSSRLMKELEGFFTKKALNFPVYVVVVQDHKALSLKIEKLFEIKHESPQIIILNKGKVTYAESHDKILIKNFIFN